MENQEKMEYIHNLIVNGQTQEMIKEIKEWGDSTFFEDYRYYLGGFLILPSAILDYFSKVVILYHKLKK